MCTAVVQLYTTSAPAHSSWMKRLTGVLCFVRDSSKRSYFLRIYNILKNELLWEEEMYDSILINKSRDFLITFEGRVCISLIKLSLWNRFSFNQCEIYFLGFNGSVKFCFRCWSKYILQNCNNNHIKSNKTTSR